MQRAPHKAMLCLCAPLRQCSFVACRLFSCDHVPLCRQVDFHVIRPQVFVWSAWHLEFHDSLTNESDLKKSGGWGAHQPMREFWKNNISVEVKLLSESKVYGALLPRRLFLDALKTPCWLLRVRKVQPAIWPHPFIIVGDPHLVT